MDAAQPPAAALAYLADFGEAPPGICFRLDPVHLRADTSGLVLLPARFDDLDDNESGALFETVADWLEQDGWTMRRASADRWYVCSDTPRPLPSTHPVSELEGRPVSGFLPTGPGARDWLQRINEVQMLLHDHPVIRARAARGGRVPNGVWLWGGGVLPASAGAPWERVSVASGTLRGLAVLQGISRASMTNCSGVLAPGGDLLLELDACARAGADVQAWCAALTRLEDGYFAPLLGALARGAVRQLELFPLDGFRYPLRRADLLALWRRPRPCHRVLAVRAGFSASPPADP